jgi:hypothetical protein
MSWDDAAVDQVFVFEVEDSRASGWSAEIAVRARRPAEAFRILRDAGLRKSQFTRGIRPTWSMSPDELGDLLSARGMARRLLDDEGWTPWSAVEDGLALNWRDAPRRR